MAKSSYTGTQMGSLAAHTVKSKGMSGVTATKSGSNGMRQMITDLHDKYDTKRKHA